MRARSRRCAAIGLSGQMHGAMLLDAAGRVLRPASCGTTAAAPPSAPSSTRGWPELRAVTGNLAMPGFTAPKLLWVREHEPEVFAGSRACCCPKDYLRLRLTGEQVEDRSDAAGTLWLDVGRRDWSDAMLAATGLRRAQMPRLVEGSEPAGELRAGVARRWGFAPRVVVAGGAGDNAAGAVGVGVGPRRRRLRVARHLGRALRRQRLLRARARSARCTPSATACPGPGTRWP